MSMERNGVTFSRRLRGALANSVRRQSHVSSSHALILRSVEREPVQIESIEVPDIDIDNDDQLGHSGAVHCKINTRTGFLGKADADEYLGDAPVWTGAN